MSYINYQLNHLKEFMRKNGSLKIMCEALITFEKVNVNDEVDFEFTHTIHSIEDMIY